jgi:methionine-rich copper-binding protein CopC
MFAIPSLVAIRRKPRRPAIASVVLVLALLGSTGSASAHSYPQTSDPQANARLGTQPAHVAITYDGGITPSGSSMVLLDSTGSPVQTAADPTTGGKQASVHPTTDMAPGPYTVNWTSLSSDDGHTAEGFYTVVVNGGPIGIIDGTSQAQPPAADMMATLTVSSAPDGSSLLRVDLNKTTGVERIRIRLYRPDLGEDLLDTTPHPLVMAAGRSPTMRLRSLATGTPTSSSAAPTWSMTPWVGSTSPSTAAQVRRR